MYSLRYIADAFAATIKITVISRKAVIGKGQSFSYPFNLLFHLRSRVVTIEEYSF